MKMKMYTLNALRRMSALDLIREHLDEIHSTGRPVVFQSVSPCGCVRSYALGASLPDATFCGDKTTYPDQPFNLQ